MSPPLGPPLSLHEVEGCRPAKEGELRLDLLGEGVCKNVKAECAGEKLSMPSGIHWSPRSLRQVGGGECGATLGLLGVPWLLVHGHSGHYVGPHVCSSTCNVTK